MFLKKNRFLLLVALLFAALGLHAQNPCSVTVTVTQPAPLSCQNPSVQLQSTVTPAGNYQYSWFGPQQLPNIPNPTVTVAGSYSLFVFDSMQCWGGDTILVTQDGSIPQVAITSASPGCGGDRTLTANVTGVGSFTYQWSNGATTQSIAVPNPAPGTVITYGVTVTNTSGPCSGAAFFVVSAQNGPLTAAIDYFDSPFCNDSLGMWVEAIGGTFPFTYLWNTGSTTNWIPDPPAGTYIVTVTDANGCTAVATQLIENDPGECANIEGYVYADWNTNCTFQSGTDNGFSTIILRITNASGDQYFTNTDGGGFYRVEVYPGAYTIEVVLPTNNLWSACVASYNVNLASNQTAIHDFFLQPEAICPAMSVDISTPFLRRCFPSLYSVFYCNDGTATADDAFVEIQLDPFLSLTSSSIPGTNLGNNRYRFDLGDVPIGQCGTFHLNVLVSCNSTLGQTHCSEAIIYPTGACEPSNPLWSGASLELNGTCQGDTLDFTIRNIGAAATSVPLGYVIIEDAVMLMQAPPPAIYLAPGQEHHVRVPANGATWRLEVEQEPFHPGNSMPSEALEGCANGGPFSVGFVNQFPANDNDAWVDIDCRQNIGSYDPNDKQGFPVGYGTARHIEPGTEIEYLIRFQNTGTDTAFTVVVRDELSEWLDPATIRPGASSHPYVFEFYGDRNIKFTFDDILLPDSNTNLAGSQGFVKFRIAQKANVPLQTDIKNSADIFFDFNEPVVTNTTVHRVGQNFVSVSTWNPLRPGLDLRVLPNPVAESALLELSGLGNILEWQVELRDVTGRTVRTATATGNQWRFERGNLPAGMYLLEVRAEGQVVGSGKVVLR
ncbi:MAG: T9SS type A sorting domain-containing protein [Saprospiraceae bacterium]